MKELIQKVLLLFSSLATLAVFLVILIMGIEVLAYVILPLLLLWLIVGFISRLGKKEEHIYHGKETGDILDIPPEDFTSTPIK